MKRVFILCFILLIQGCNKVSFHSLDKAEKINVDATFVDSFLKNYFHKSVSKNIPIIISEELCPFFLKRKGPMTSCEELLEQAEKKDKNIFEAANDYCLKNIGGNKIDSISPLTVKHRILTQDQFAQIYNNGGWKLFYKKFSGAEGFVRLSRPGFGKNGNIAVFYMLNSYSFRGTERTGGYGKFYIMEKIDGKWIESNMSIGGLYH